MNKLNLICTVAFATIVSATVVAGPGGGGTPPGGGGNQPGGNQPGGGSSATWTFDTFLASATTTSGLIIREGVITGYASPTSVTVASTVEDIAEGALAGCTTLTSIDLSATSITQIPESAFAGCSNLATVILPSTCTTIGANAFAGCTKLVTLTASGVTTVGNDSFRACSALTTHPSTIRAAGAFSFAQSGVTSVDLTGMTSVGEGAFAGCESLTAATVAADATLPDALFAGCTALDAGIPATTLTLSDSASLGAYALAADEATIVTTLSGASVPAYDAITFLGREVSYTPVAGSATRIEAFDLVFSQTGVSSTCELLYRILKSLPDVGGYLAKIPMRSLEALLTGMTTDTNNFSNSVFPGTLEMASELIAAGVDRDRILSDLYNQYRENRLRLMGFLLQENMEITPSGVAMMILDKETQDRFDFRQGETEGFVNIPLAVSKVKMSVFLTEEEGKFRVSVRSKRGVSANQFASKYFHGGGHEMASGGKLLFPQDIPSPSDAKAYILNVTKDYFGI